MFTGGGKGQMMEDTIVTLMARLADFRQRASSLELDSKTIFEATAAHANRPGADDLMTEATGFIGQLADMVVRLDETLHPNGQV